jgi:repressor LexA
VANRAVHHHPDDAADMYLTKRQKEILDYIAEHVDQRGYAPTLEEIGAHFGLSSPATVYKHVQRLVQKGYLRKTRHQGRGIEVVGAEPERSIEVPLRGELRPGRRIDPVRPPELAALPPSFRGHALLYALRVRGTGLEDQQLLDGDILVIEERAPERDGDVALLVSAGGTPALAPCRRQDGGFFVRTGEGAWRLLGAAGDEVRGVLVGAIRAYG